MRKRWIASALSCFMAVSTILSGCGSSTGTSVQSEVTQENNEEEAVSTEVAEENPVDDQIRENFLEIKNNVSPMILDIVNGDGSQYDKAAFEQALVDIESAQMLVDVMLSDRISRRHWIPTISC